MANKAGDWLYNQEDLIIGIVALVGGAHIILELIMSKTDTMFGMTVPGSKALLGVVGTVLFLGGYMKISDEWQMYRRAKSEY
jgi:hypothetical protein